MSEEIRKDAQDAKLNLEDLDKVTGGIASPWEDWNGQCPFCGGTNCEYIPGAGVRVCRDCDREIVGEDLL